MTLVDTATGEVVARCTPDEARKLTDAIRVSSEALWSLLAEAHERRAWAALGYPSFKAYVDGEFAMSEVHAYRLLNQAQVIRELSEAAGLTRGLVDVSEREARDLKPHLTEVAEEVRAATKDAPPEQRRDLAREAMDSAREAMLAAQKAAQQTTPRPAAKTPAEQREIDLVESDKRTARGLEKLTELWPCVESLDRNPRRALILSHLVTPTLDTLARIEEQLGR